MLEELYENTSSSSALVTQQQECSTRETFMMKAMIFRVNLMINFFRANLWSVVGIALIAQVYTYML